MKERYHLLDALRGFAIYHVIIFHFLYDIYVVYGLNPDWPHQTAIQLWQRNGCGLFVLVSGMVFTLGSNAFKRGLQLQVLGAIITLVTVLCTPGEAIYYGILTFFGSVMWLTWLLEKWLKQVSPVHGMLACVLAYLLTLNIGSGVVKIGSKVLFELPQWLYHDSLAIFGLHGANFHSADYVPLLPHAFIFLFGMYLFAYLRAHNRLSFLTSGNWKIFTIPGRHSLVIYILHQPVLMALCYVMFGKLP